MYAHYVLPFFVPLFLFMNLLPLYIPEYEWPSTALFLVCPRHIKPLAQHDPSSREQDALIAKDPMEVHPEIDRWPVFLWKKRLFTSILAIIVSIRWNELQKVAVRVVNDEADPTPAGDATLRRGNGFEKPTDEIAGTVHDLVESLDSAEVGSR